VHDGSSVASRLHATAIIRAMAAGCSLLGMDASHLVCAGCPFARMAVAMLVPGRNGCGSSRRNASKAAHPKPPPPNGRGPVMQHRHCALKKSVLLLSGGLRDLIGQALQGLSWRVAYPCRLGGRFRSPLERSSVASRTPSDRPLHPHPCWGKQTCRIQSILARPLHILVTLSDYSLPERFISDRICFSPLRLS
jgi:hypothetical protein